LTIVRWLATGYVIVMGGLLVVAALQAGTLQNDASISALVAGALLLAAGIVLRPRRGTIG
jgi:hypothetical protein